MRPTRLGVADNPDPTANYNSADNQSKESASSAVDCANQPIAAWIRNIEASGKVAGNQRRQRDRSGDRPPTGRRLGAAISAICHTELQRLIR